LSGVHFFAKKVDDLFSRRPQRLLLWLGVHFVSCGCTYTLFL